MTNEIAKVFSSERFGNVRVVVLTDEPWFVGKDIAETLGYKNTNKAVMEHVDSEDKFMRSTRGNEIGKLFSSLKEMQEIFGRQDNWFINESGIYSMIFGSTLPVAREFKRWITHEVLPSIRKTGSYNTIPQTYVEALRLAADQAEQIEQQNLQLLEAKPKVEFFDAVADSKDAIEIASVAKVLGIKGMGRNNLFELLRNKKILMNNNCPYQKYVDGGYFRVLEQKFCKPNGDTCINIKTLVYQKGVDYIRKVAQEES